MNLLSNAFGIHEQALQVRSQRLEVLARNIANADTPNYKAQDLDFKAMLKEVKKDYLTATHDKHFAAVADAGEATVTLWSKPDKHYRAKLRELSPAADATTRTFAARYTILDPDAAISLGMSAVLDIATPGARPMARVMSIAFMVFMVVPVMAPAFGQTVLLFANWRGIFWVVAGLSLGIWMWFFVRMPETLRPEARQPLSVSRIWAGWKQTLGDRLSLGYTLASTSLMGALYGYLNSVQQIMFDTFDRPKLLAVMFAVTATLMAGANLTNARLVMRLGTRLISHSAVTMLVVLSAIHLAIALAGYETLVGFVVLQALTMGCFGLATSNFSSMAMENMGGIAGTASSVQGFTSITVGAVVGVVIGQAFNGTTAPLAAGFLICGLMSLLVVAITERFRLFRPA